MLRSTEVGLEPGTLEVGLEPMTGSLKDRNDHLCDKSLLHLVQYLNYVRYSSGLFV